VVKRDGLMAETVVKFGTDGWRGIIADDFTYANVRVAARAIAHYVLKHEDAKRGVCVGWDTRFGSRAFAGVVAEVLAGAGIPVQLASGDYADAGAELCGAREKAAGGVMITSSHNPAEWNGVKYKASYGGSGRPAIMAAIEGYLGEALPEAGGEGAD
jgi:phosphomannomutase